MPERRALLGVLLLATVVVGVWSLFAPASFYDDFPLDRAWVSIDGPFNEHLIRDDGALNLALGVVIGWALRHPTLERVRLACGAMLAYALPHLAYHATHLGGFQPGDAAAQILALTLTVAAPLWLLWRTTQVTA